MNEVNSIKDCLDLVAKAIVQTTYFISIQQLEQIHNFLINMPSIKFIENMIVISNVLKYINYMIDEYQSLHDKMYGALRKLIIDVVIEINNKGDTLSEKIVHSN